jgi:hypothetical protein
LPANLAPARLCHPPECKCDFLFASATDHSATPFPPSPSAARDWNRPACTSARGLFPGSFGFPGSRWCSSTTRDSQWPVRNVAGGTRQRVSAEKEKTERFHETRAFPRSTRGGSRLSYLRLGRARSTPPSAWGLGSRRRTSPAATLPAASPPRPLSKEATRAPPSVSARESPRGDVSR